MQPAAARRPVAGLLAAQIALLGAGCAALLSASSAHGSPLHPVAGAVPRAKAASSAVGALFLPGQSTHFCTAAVVDSPTGDVLLTAAHCLVGTGSGLRFVPGYGATATAAGAGVGSSWTVTAAFAPAAWLQQRDQRHDYAFLRVTRTDDGTARAKSRTVEQAVGSVGTPVAADDGELVTVVGYEVGSNDGQVRCTSRVSSSSGDAAVHCDGHGLGIGTSGSPWIAGSTGSGAGRVVGVVGGLHQGGCTSDVSYSPRFDADTTAVLQQADSSAAGDALPNPGGDGC